MDLNPNLLMDQDQAERFERILQTLDFSICKDDYDVAKLMFIRMDAVIKILREEIKEMKNGEPRSSLPEGFSEEIERLGANRNKREGSQSPTGNE